MNKGERWRRRRYIWEFKGGRSQLTRGKDIDQGGHKIGALSINLQVSLTIHF
jgi:hypothetical protein